MTSRLFAPQLRSNRLRHALLSSAMLAIVAVPAVAYAQADSPSAQARAGEVQFNVPPQELDSALTSVADQGGIRIFFTSAELRGARSNGASGAMSVEQALSQVLTGSGFGWRYREAGTVVIERVPKVSDGAIQLGPVRVEGTGDTQAGALVPAQAMIGNLPPPYAGGQVATGGQVGLLGNRDVLDTPFNQTNYTAKKAQDQQATTLRDVLIDDPSVRSHLSDVGGGYEYVSIRGFYLHPDNVAYNGLYGVLPGQSIMAELAERVEVQKGPGAMVNGMAPSDSIGGTINVVPKRAPEEGLAQVTANYISASQFGGHVDVGRRFGKQKEFGVRFNGVFRGGRTPVDFSSSERGLALLGLDFRGQRVRFSADIGYQHQIIDGEYPSIGLAVGVPLPNAPDASANPGQPWSSGKRKDVFGVARVEFDLASNVTTYAALGAHEFEISGLRSWGVTVINSNGDALGRSQTYFFQGWKNLSAEAGLRASLSTGSIHHEIALAATRFEREDKFAGVNGVAFPTNIYNPVIVARPNSVPVSAPKTADRVLSSFALADTVSSADGRFQLTLGARLQKVEASTFSPTGATTSRYEEDSISPSVALVFKPRSNISVYANYIEGLQQGTTVPGTFANAGDVFPPYKSTQYEAGVKVDWGSFTTTANIFQISQPSVLAVPGASLPSLELDGERRHRGIEINVFGEPVTGVRLIGGAMFLDPKLTKTADGLADGWTAPFAPKVNLNLGVEWDLPYLSGITLNGRAVYTGSQYIDTTSPRRKLPDSTRFDLGARYAFASPLAEGKSWIARFSVENLFDKSYWQGGSGSSALNLGAPRTVRLSLTTDF